MREGKSVNTDPIAVKQQIFDAIQSYKRIVISRHIRPDGDAIGSTHGLAALLRASFPEKDIRLVSEESSAYLAFLGPDDETPDDSFYEDALVIVIDTGTVDRVSNKKIGLGKQLIKIDHHIDDKPYGDISWVEEERSSACEMIVDFWQSFPDELKMTKEAALPLYAGMVTDSGRFRFPSVTGETMRLAGALLDLGLDTETMFAHLNLEDYEHGTIVNCEEADVMLMMPMLDGNGYVRDVSERECMDEVVECAEIVEMAAA